MIFFLEQAPGWPSISNTAWYSFLGVGNCKKKKKAVAFAGGRLDMNAVSLCHWNTDFRVIPIKYSQSLDAMKQEKDLVCFGLRPQSPPSSIALLFLCGDFFPQPSSGALATVSCF